MSKNEATNPAHRARLFVEQFSSASMASESIRNKRVRHALAEMYDIKSDDNSSLMAVLSDAWKFPGQIKVDLEKSGLDQEDYSDALNALESFLMQLNVDTHAQAVKNGIPSSLISSLRMISGILNKVLPEVSLSDENRDRILEIIDNLDKAIHKTKFDDEFTGFLLHKLAGIRYAVSHCDTLGQDELMAKVDQMFGGVLRQYNKLTDSKEKKDLTHRLLQIGAVIIYTVSAFNGAMELPENMNKFIGEGVIQQADIIIDKPLEASYSSDVIV